MSNIVHNTLTWISFNCLDVDTLPAVVNMERCYGRSNTEKESLKGLNLTITLSITTQTNYFGSDSRKSFHFVIVSKATLRPKRAPNKTPALAQEWAVWSKPTLDLMHVTLTARKQRVYSKLIFKTSRRHCVIGFGNCPSGTWSFIVKHNMLTHNRRRFGQRLFN